MSTRLLERAKREAQMHVKAVETITERAAAEGRDLTTEEERKATRHLEQARAAAEQARQHHRDGQTMKAIRDLGNNIGMPDPTAPATPRVKALGGGTWGSDIVDRLSDPHGFKALTPSGTAVVTVPLATEPVRMDTPVLALRQLIPTVPDTAGRWSYLRQIVRTNNADVVAPGARKPTSVYGLERVENRARTIAHLSEPVPRQDLDDAPALRAFVDSELRLGVELTLEDEIVNGDGTGEHFTGLANVSGAQAQAFATDALTTARQAITKLEVINLAASGFVLHPADWEVIELAGNAYGYTLAQAGQAVPVDRAARRLWGVPVALSTTVPVGTGYAADFASSTELKLREDVRVDWSENVWDPNALGAGQGASDFERNLLRFRAEMRAGLDVTRPLGVVEMALTAG